MPVKTPRKKDAEVPKLEGWTFQDIPSNLFSPCHDCGKKEKEFFWRVETIPGSNTIATTRIRCVPCSRTALNEGKQA